jgi:hypothetical protein
MNLSSQDIEAVLRSAPRPIAPMGLKSQLAAQVNLATSAPEKPSATVHAASNWFRRWWPILVPAAASLVCMAVFAVQQLEIRGLKESLRSLSQPPAPEVQPSATTIQSNDIAPALEPEAAEAEEIQRLKTRVQELTDEIARLEQIQIENAHLRQQLAAAPGLTSQELDALAKAREKALSIQCINNLKQFGLAVRIWETDNAEMSPPNVICMSNELSTAKILLCPADTNRVAASNWATFTAANLSYEYLSASATNASAEPMRVLSRCPLHGHIGLCDGSVQGEVARKHPEWLAERDGKLYYKHGTSPTKP